MNLWTAEPGSLADGSRATHLQWANVLDVIEKVWGMDASDDERALAEFVCRLVADLSPRWNSERLVLEKELGIIPPSTLPIVMPSVPERIPDVASAVASDHRQRAVEVDADNPEQLDEARLQIADEIAASGIGGGHVRPWIWRAASSGGKPLTQLGRETGYEIRVSWYR